MGSLRVDPKLRILINPNVHIGALSWPMIEASLAVWEAYQIEGVRPIMTGAADPSYPKGGVHDRGLAWDFRIWALRDPARVAEAIRGKLQDIDKRWVVLYGDSGHQDHIHVGLGHDAEKIYY